MSNHWCTYCQGQNTHNCQFNTELPRVQTYLTNNTASSKPAREWVGLTDEEYQELHLQMGAVYFYQDYGRAIEAKLREKNA